MTAKTEYLREQFFAYLDRRSMPRGLEGKPDAQMAEMNALMDCLSRFAPASGYGDWWVKIERLLGENSKTRAWPIENEIKTAAMTIRGPSTTGQAKGDEINPLKLAAKRMASGEPVGDEYLYGRLAVDLIKDGGVAHDTLRKYRSAWYFSLKNVYKEEKARKLEAEAILRHEQAEQVHKATGGISGRIPEPKRMTQQSWDGENA